MSSTSNRHGKGKTPQPWTTTEEITLAIDKKTTQSNPPTPEKPSMPHISSFLTIEESTDEHEICDGYITKKEQQQQFLDEEALKETLEEEARAEKELEEKIKMLEKKARKEQAHDELFRLEFGVKSDSKYESD
ncbi:hypothetical protein Tco_0489053 [Tanacetum coccineum]